MAIYLLQAPCLEVRFHPFFCHLSSAPREEGPTPPCGGVPDREAARGPRGPTVFSEEPDVKGHPLRACSSEPPDVCGGDTGLLSLLSFVLAWLVWDMGLASRVFMVYLLRE